MKSVRELDHYVENTDAIVADLGFIPTELEEVASDWNFTPARRADRLRTRNLEKCRAGTWRERPAAALIFLELLAEKGPIRLRQAAAFLQVVAVRLDVPAAACNWVVAKPKWPTGKDSPLSMRRENPAAPPTMLPNVVRGLVPRRMGFEVPAPVEPDKWRVRAHNTRFAEMLMTECPWLLSDPMSGWQIDGFDLVHVESIPLGTEPLNARERLDRVHHAAETAERLIRLGYGDRPYSPEWPEGSHVTERFPADVLDALHDAGWAAGRRVPVEELLHRGTNEKDGITPFPEAEAALREFGGLHLRHASPFTGAPAGTVTFDPSLVPPRPIRRTHRLFFPLGKVDQPVFGKETYLVIGTSGYVYGLRDDDDILMGFTIDEAIIKLARGIFSPPTSRGLRRPPPTTAPRPPDAK